MMNVQWVELPKKIEEKVVTDVFGRINKKVVADVLSKICVDNLSFKKVLDQIDSIHVIQRKETYHTLIDSISQEEDWGNLLKENFYQIYSFEKPKGYSVRGLCFDKKRIIIINLHQLFQCADEYAQYVNSDERVQKRDYRYFAKDCHNEKFKEIISNKYEAVNFLFWNTLFEQFRAFQQSIEKVDLMEFGYKEEGSATINDMNGFANHMYQQYVTIEKKPIE